MARQKPLLKIRQTTRRKTAGQLRAIRVNEFMRMLSAMREAVGEFSPATATDDEVARFVEGAQRVWHQARYFQRFLFIGDSTSQAVAAAIEQQFQVKL